MLRQMILAMVVIGSCVLATGLILGLITRAPQLGLALGGFGFALIAFAQAARTLSLAHTH